MTKHRDGRPPGSGKRINDVERMKQSRQRGAEKMKAKAKPGARAHNRRNEYIVQRDEHGKPVQQWCFLCNAAHGYHKATA